jgi:hypothetical protein
VPTRREVLQIFQYPRVQPEAPYDPGGTTVQCISGPSDRCRPGICNEMLNIALKAGAHHVLRRQQGQESQYGDATPGQETKRHSKKAGAHRHRVSHLGAFGKSCAGKPPGDCGRLTGVDRGVTAEGGEG